MMADALEKRLNELALRAAHTGTACYTRFLEPSQADAVRAGTRSSPAPATGTCWAR